MEQKYSLLMPVICRKFRNWVVRGVEADIMLLVCRIRYPSCWVSQIQVTFSVGYCTFPRTWWYISNEFQILSEAADLISKMNFQLLLNKFTLCNSEPSHLRVKADKLKNIFWKWLESSLSLEIGMACIIMKIFVTAAEKNVVLKQY